MIFDPALVTAKPPPPPPFSALLHDISAAWADIYWHIIMPLGIIVFVPTCVAAKFLPRNMTRWLKRLPAVQALQDSLFLTHDLSAPCLFTPILPQGERYSAILRLHMSVCRAEIYNEILAEMKVLTSTIRQAALSAVSQKTAV